MSLRTSVRLVQDWVPMDVFSRDHCRQSSLRLTDCAEAASKGFLQVWVDREGPATGCRPGMDCQIGRPGF